MNLAFFLKIFTDLCYYGMYAAFFASIYGLTGSIMPQFVLLALAAALSRMADRRWPGKPVRLLPLLLCLAVFAVPTQTAGLVILAPAALYVIFCCATRRTQPEYYAALDAFGLELKLLILPALLAVALVQLKQVEQFSVPYLLVFLLGSVLLLRMLRHDEATLSQPRFRLMNALSMALLCLVCGVLGSAMFRSLLGTVLKGVWNVLSIPVLLFLGTIGMGMAWILMTILPDDLAFEGIQQEGIKLPDESDRLPSELLEEQASDPSRVVVFMISALLIVLAILAVVLLFRKLAAARRTDSVSGPEQRRFAAASMPPPQRPLTRLGARTPELQVRYWYQQLLCKTRQEGGELQAHMDTRQQSRVEDSTFPKRSSEIIRMRQLYLPARYKGHATEQDAKEARSLYQQIKK